MPPKKVAEKKPAAAKEKKPVTSATAVAAPAKPTSNESKPNAESIEASTDFEAGVMFSRFGNVQNGGGILTADEFRRMWRDVKVKDNNQATSPIGVSSINENVSSNLFTPTINTAAISFEAGQIFTKFDADGDGKLNKREFESLITNYPELSRIAGLKSGEITSNNTTSLPLEVITGRLLTHYDETSGIAIPRTSIDHHKIMGHTVVPLLEAYRARYDHLRGLLTSKLLPRREQLLQLRRNLRNCSTDITAVRKGIERETLTDSEQIIERLRSIESMRQSSISHQVLQLEEELESIERVIRRVEVASDSKKQSTGILLASAMPNDIPIENINLPKADSMIELIQQFPDLSSNIEKLSVKPITVQVDFPIDDFPKETAERLEIIAHADRYMHALSVKDHMLWSSIQEKTKAEEMVLEEKRLSREYAEEMSYWVEMVQALSKQLVESRSDNEKLERRSKQLVQTLREHNIFFPQPDV